MFNWYQLIDTFLHLKKSKFYNSKCSICPGKSEALIELVTRVQENQKYSHDVTDGILRFLLHLTNGNLTDTDPYPTEITPLNHVKFRKYATEKDRSGILSGTADELLQNYWRHYERVNTLWTHPKSVFNMCQSVEEHRNRALYSHPGQRCKFASPLKFKKSSNIEIQYIEFCLQKSKFRKKIENLKIKNKNHKILENFYFLVQNLKKSKV